MTSLSWAAHTLTQRAPAACLLLNQMATRKAQLRLSAPRPAALGLGCSVMLRLMLLSEHQRHLGQAAVSF